MLVVSAFSVIFVVIITKVMIVRVRMSFNTRVMISEIVLNLTSRIYRQEIVQQEYTYMFKELDQLVI